MAFNQEIRSKLSTDTVVFINPAFDNSIIGTTFEGNAIYDFDLMVKELMNDEGWSEEESIEWIEYNTIRAIPYCGGKPPLIVYNY